MVRDSTKGERVSRGRCDRTKSKLLSGSRKDGTFHKNV